MYDKDIAPQHANAIYIEDMGYRESGVSGGMYKIPCISVFPPVERVQLSFDQKIKTTHLIRGVSFECN